MDFVRYVRDNGGYVHPDLQLLVGDEAEHGQVSLAGVPHDVLSLRIPTALAERRLNDNSVWLRFVQSLGAVIDAHYIGTRSFRKGVMPLASAANHNSGEVEPAGRVIDGHDYLELYGVDFTYAASKEILAREFGIAE